MTVAPSALPFGPGWHVPEALSLSGLVDVTQQAALADVLDGLDAPVRAGGRPIQDFTDAVGHDVGSLQRRSLGLNVVSRSGLGGGPSRRELSQMPPRRCASSSGGGLLIEPSVSGSLPQRNGATKDCGRSV